MVLPGLQLIIPIGYLNGLIILTQPWGTPKFRWISVPTLISVMILPGFVLINVDIMVHQWNNITRSGVKSTVRVDNIVVTGSFFELIISCVTMRFIFFAKARNIRDVLERFRAFAKRRLDWRGACTNIDILLCSLVFLSTFGIAILEGWNWNCYYNEVGVDQSWIRKWLGEWPHVIAIVTVFVFTAVVPMQCAFAFIVVFSGYLSVAIEDYCQYVLDLVQEHKWLGMSIGTQKNKDQKKFHVMEQSRQNFTEEIRKEIIARFEIIREVFDLAYSIMSPMALILLGGTSIAIVMKSYEIVMLSGNGDMVVICRDLCHMVNYVSYLWILQCGQRVADKVVQMKTKLDNTLVDLSSEIHFMEKQAVKDVQKLIAFWNWKFTALDIFVIDRTLASGLVSIIMNYVVVLVQLKVSDSPDVVSSNQ